jgi:hypothetical protein
MDRPLMNRGSSFCEKTHVLLSRICIREKGKHAAFGAPLLESMTVHAQEEPG